MHRNHDLIEELEWPHMDCLDVFYKPMNVNPQKAISSIVCVRVVFIVEKK